MQLTDRADEDVELMRAPVGCFDAPLAALLVEFGFADFLAEANVFVQVVFFCAVLEIGEDLFLFRPFMGPIWITFEGKGVEGGGDITFSTGVGVFAPSAADAVCLLEDDERIYSEFSELNSQA